ncbi:MAG: hypothetical protein H6791_02350 [Candidatus Nomurabacteria bacterium]|nr:MAG: hypothetical protein H6791_02350 [Candidatus Nomurabacteria bacterium]
MNKKKILLFSLVYYPDFVGGKEGEIYFTNSHYKSFKKIKIKTKYSSNNN